MEIKESQIEDILTASPELAKTILKLDDEPKFLGRQIIIPSGRLDMLYAYNTELLLVELKITSFHAKFIPQILNYKNDLLNFQQEGKLIKGDIIPFLILPRIDKNNLRTVEKNGIRCYEYNPEDILKYFYSEKLKPITSFIELKPIDVGIWNIHLINKFIFELQDTNSVKELQDRYNGASKTLYNKIKFASELGLVIWMPNRDYIELSELGKEYVMSADKRFLMRLSDTQINLLRNYVMQNPYSSSIVLGIASLIESVFALSRNTYPVPLSQLIDYFTYYSGKIYDWKTAKAKFNGTKMYSNYAVDLGLLAKNDERVYLTPDGFKFVIQMQLHKSIKLMNNLSVV
jgi:hypothetical protein